MKCIWNVTVDLYFLHQHLIVSAKPLCVWFVDCNGSLCNRIDGATSNRTERIHNALTTQIRAIYEENNGLDRRNVLAIYRINVLTRVHIRWWAYFAFASHKLHRICIVCYDGNTVWVLGVACIWVTFKTESRSNASVGIIAPTFIHYCPRLRRQRMIGCGGVRQWARCMCMYSLWIWWLPNLLSWTFVCQNMLLLINIILFGFTSWCHESGAQNVLDLASGFSHTISNFPVHVRWR